LKNHVIRQSKTPREELERHGMKIQEVSEDITSWGNSILNSKRRMQDEMWPTTMYQIPRRNR